MASPTETAAVCSIEGALPADAVERSVRAPFLLMTFSSLVWLAISAFFGAFALVKVHAPGLLAHCPALTYGRLQPVFLDALVYGALTQAAVAVGLWLLCRMGRATLALPSLTLIATLFWNVAVTIGVVGILVGKTNGLYLADMHGGAMLMMFIAFLAFSLSALLTNARRTICTLYVSQWFLLAAFFWFPWLLSSVVWLLHKGNLPGIVHPAIHQWYANGVVALWLAPVALAVIYYFIPKMSGRVLSSFGLAAFAFWTYALFAGFGGFQFTTALPKWFPSVSSATALLLVIPALTNFYNWQTTIGKTKKPAVDGGTWTLVRISAFAYVVATILSAAPVLAPLGNSLTFTLFVPGLLYLTLLGVVGSALLAAIYYAMPRLTGVEWHKSINLHRTLTIAGSALLIMSFLIGGLIHGGSLANTQKDIVSAVRSVFPFIGIATIGALILLVGQLVGLAAFGRNCFACCCPDKNEGRVRSGRAK